MITYDFAFNMSLGAGIIGFIAGFVTAVHYIRARRRRDFRDSIRRMEENDL